jgi:hypothetical protein
VAHGAFVAAGTYTEKAAGVTTINLPLPAGAAAGDMCVALWGGNSAVMVGTQTGFTTLADHSSTADTLVPDAWIGRKTLTSTDITNGFVTLNAVPSAAANGQALVLRGFKTTQDFTAVYLDKTSTANGNFAFTAQTVSMAGVILIYIVSQNAATGGMTPPSAIAGQAWTEDGDRVAGRNVSIGHLIMRVSGSTGTITVASSSTARGVGLLIGLQPVSRPGDFFPFLSR